MYRKLNQDEVNEFVERYMPDYKDEVREVSYMDLYGLKNYLVNEHYLVMVLGDKVVQSDLQFA